MWNMVYAVIGAYLILINIAVIAIYGIDKRKAIKNKRRISEKTLILFALAGGAFGAVLAMYIFHHKTKKPKFYIGIPLILIIQIVLAVMLIIFTQK